MGPGWGDSSFQGTDINARDMGGGANGGALNTSNTYPMDSTGQAMSGLPNVDSTGALTDPADIAARDASAGADATNADPTAQSAANENTSSFGGGGSGGGIIGSLFSLLDPKARRLQKRQRSYQRTETRLREANALRAIQQFSEDAPRERAALDQSYSGRGLGQSSIQQEGMQYYDDMTARKMAALQGNYNLAQAGTRLVNSQIAASYAQPYVQLVGQAANVALSMAGGM